MFTFLFLNCCIYSNLKIFTSDDNGIYDIIVFYKHGVIVMKLLNIFSNREENDENSAMIAKKRLLVEHFENTSLVQLSSNILNQRLLRRLQENPNATTIYSNRQGKPNLILPTYINETGQVVFKIKDKQSFLRMDIPYSSQNLLLAQQTLKANRQSNRKTVNYQTNKESTNHEYKENHQNIDYSRSQQTDMETPEKEINYQFKVMDFKHDCFNITYEKNRFFQINNRVLHSVEFVKNNFAKLIALPLFFDIQNNTLQFFFDEDEFYQTQQHDDGGLIGYIYADKTQVKKHYNIKRLNQNQIKNIKSDMMNCIINMQAKTS